MEHDGYCDAHIGIGVYSYDQRNPANSGQSNRPNPVADPELSDPTIEKYFNTDAFQRNATFTYGNLGRNTMTGPGYANVDASIMKDWRVRESVEVQFRLESFKLFNHPNFGTRQACRRHQISGV